MQPGERAVTSLGLHFPSFYLEVIVTALDFEELSALRQAGLGESGGGGGVVGRSPWECGSPRALQAMLCWTHVCPLKSVYWCLYFRFIGAREPKFLESSQCKAMAQKSPTVKGNNLPYGDLASEVTRRRVTMATRYLRALWCTESWGWAGQ